MRFGYFQKLLKSGKLYQSIDFKIISEVENDARTGEYPLIQNLHEYLRFSKTVLIILEITKALTYSQQMFLLFCRKVSQFFGNMSMILNLKVLEVCKSSQESRTLIEVSEKQFMTLTALVIFL